MVLQLQLLFQKIHTTHSYSEHLKGNLARAKMYSFLVHLPLGSWLGKHCTAEDSYQKGMVSRF